MRPFVAAASMARASLTDTASGFSTITWTPRAAAASMIGRWSRVDEKAAIASGFARCRRSSSDANILSSAIS